MDRGAWWATVHGVTKSQTQLTKLTSTPHPTHNLWIFYTLKAGDFSGLQRWTAWIKTPTVVGTSLVVQWLRLHPPTEGALGTRSHVRKLRVRRQQLKVLHVATKNRCSQMYQKRKILLLLLLLHGNFVSERFLSVTWTKTNSNNNNTCQKELLWG